MEDDHHLNGTVDLLQDDVPADHALHEGDLLNTQQDAQETNILVHTDDTFEHETESHAERPGIEEDHGLVELGDSGAGAVQDDALIWDSEQQVEPQAAATEQALVHQLQEQLAAPLADQRAEVLEHVHVNADEKVHAAPETLQDPAPASRAAPAPEPAPAPAPASVTPSDNVQRQQVAAKPTSPAKEKSPSPTAGVEVCCVCGKKVYPLEKLVAEKRLFHKTCFRCKKCNRTLNSSNYATLNSDYYCKPHQLELFRLQGRYEVTETPAEVVNRTPATSPTSEASASVTESSAEELRRARAMFEKSAEQPAQYAIGGAQVDLSPAQYGGVGALKSRYLANASQNAASGDAGRPPPRKITPPRHDASALKANGNGFGYADDTALTGHGEFENEPLRIEGVVRESDRAQFEAELPKQGTAKSAFAMFRNLESTNKATGASVSASQEPDLHDSPKVDNSEAS